jgi:hypothetical protein
MDVRFSITGDLSELFELLNIEVIDIEDEIEFEDDEVEADEDGIEYDSEGVAWWYDEETEVYYYFDEDADDWLEYDESEEV